MTRALNWSTHLFCVAALFVVLVQRVVAVSECRSSMLLQHSTIEGRRILTSGTNALHDFGTNKDRKCTHWEPRAPEFCDMTMSAALPSITNPAPGRASKRIAILFWKRSFMGPNGLVHLAEDLNSQDNPRSHVDRIPGDTNKEFWMCTELAEQMQRAVSQAHVTNIIEPLEQMGRTVDVFISSPRCSNYGADSEYSNHLETELIKYYSSPSREIEAEFFDTTGGDSQAFSAMKGSNLFLETVRRTGRVYESVLVWRFDIVPFNKLADPSFKFEETNASQQESTCGPPRQTQEFSDMLSGGYLAYATNTILAVEDHTLSFPWWTVPCIFNNLAGDGTAACGTAAVLSSGWLGLDNGKDDCHLRANFDWQSEPKKDGAVLHAVWPQRHDWFIYRGPMGLGFQVYGGPFNDCMYLEKKFGGPKCNYHEIAKFVCKTWCAKQQNIAACMSDVWPSFKRVALADANQKHWESSNGGREAFPEQANVDRRAPELLDKDAFLSVC